MLRLKALGWSVRRIAGELGCNHMTVRRYLAEGRIVSRSAPSLGRPRERVAAGRRPPAHMGAARQARKRSRCVIQGQLAPGSQS
jgi:hypothetical protein